MAGQICMYMPNGNFRHTFANYFFPLGNLRSDSIKQTVLYIEWYSNNKLISQNKYPLIKNVSGEWWIVLIKVKILEFYQLFFLLQ